MEETERGHDRVAADEPSIRAQEKRQNKPTAVTRTLVKMSLASRGQSKAKPPWPTRRARITSDSIRQKLRCETPSLCLRRRPHRGSPAQTILSIQDFSRSAACRGASCTILEI